MKKVSDRLSKALWLEKSLELLAKQGEQKLTIDHVVKAMGVTKGSFYWHFKNRSEYINSLVDYWAVMHTECLANELSSISDPADQLLKLMQLLTEGDHSRYDVSIMNWGLHEPIEREKMQDMFNFRLNVVRSLFEKMGFKGDDLEMRVHTMVFFQTMECSAYTHLSKEERLRHVALRHRMLIAK
jgi:AcrR family transcriptional regulator